jgi:ABC-2 type transport system ATP-binding protein
MGKTIMVSSHILPELADICNKIGIIERGELIVNADVEDVMKQVRQQTVLKIDVSTDREKAGRLLEEHPMVEKIEVDKTGLRVTLVMGDHDFSQLARLLLDNGHALTKLGEEEINLETAFMTLTKGITS